LQGRKLIDQLGYSGAGTATWPSSVIELKGIKEEKEQVELITVYSNTEEVSLAVGTTATIRSESNPDWYSEEHGSKVHGSTEIK
jgi:hypothetical protein